LSAFPSLITDDLSGSNNENPQNNINSSNTNNNTINNTNKQTENNGMLFSHFEVQDGNSESYHPLLFCWVLLEKSSPNDPNQNFYYTLLRKQQPQHSHKLVYEVNADKPTCDLLYVRKMIHVLPRFVVQYGKAKYIKVPMVFYVEANKDKYRDIFNSLSGTISGISGRQHEIQIILVETIEELRKWVTDTEDSVSPIQFVLGTVTGTITGTSIEQHDKFYEEIKLIKRDHDWIDRGRFIILCNDQSEEDRIKKWTTSSSRDKKKFAVYYKSRKKLLKKLLMTKTEWEKSEQSQ